MSTIHPEPAGRAGFTLIEVLVALAVAAIGMAAFLSATGVGLQNEGIADQYIQATRRAQSHLAEVGVAIPLKQGDYSGDDGSGFRWRVQVAAPLTYSKAAGGQSPAAVLYPVEVGVNWQSGISRREVLLRSARMGSK